MPPVQVTDVPRDQVGDTVQQMLIIPPLPERITVEEQDNDSTKYTVTGFFN